MKLKVWNEKIRTFLSTAAAFVCLAIIFKLKSFNDFQSWKIARDGNFLKWFVYLKSTYREKSTWIFVNFLVFFVKQCATFLSLKISIELMGLKIDFFSEEFSPWCHEEEEKKSQLKRQSLIFYSSMKFISWGKLYDFCKPLFFRKAVINRRRFLSHTRHCDLECGQCLSSI